MRRSVTWSGGSAGSAADLPCWCLALIAWLLATAASGSMAQAADAASPQSAAVAASAGVAKRASPVDCLIQGDPKNRPRYRSEDAKMHREFTVRLELTFRSPRDKPQIDVVYSNADQPLLDEVTDFASSYRLPCLPDGAPPVKARQDFDFVQQGRAVWMPVRAADDPPDHSRCLRDASTPADRDFHYPMLASITHRGGAVLVQISFSSPDLPPTVRNLYVGGGDAFADAADAMAANYRLPCLPKGETAVFQQMFDFSPEGRRAAFRDMPLASYLGMVEHIEVDRQRFDFTTMGCPFDVRMIWYQPYATNSVAEIGGTDPNRREFMEWLRSLALSMSEDKKRLLLGKPFTISVPCGTLDLTS